jgi:hypothetical protein
MTAAATFALCIFLGMLLAGGRKKRASPTYKETTQPSGSSGPLADH